MASLQSLFSGQSKSGLYRLRGSAQDETLNRLAKEHGWRVRRLNGDKIHSKAAFIRAVSDALNFPDYSAANWDAFEESLRDLSWLPEQPIALVYDQPNVWARADGATWAIARDILGDAARAGRSGARPLTILFRRAGRALPDIPWL